jgi:CRP-like cAMP-binding protein
MSAHRIDVAYRTATVKARRGAHPLGPCGCVNADLAGIAAACKTGERIVHAGKTIFRIGEPCRDAFAIRDGWVYLYALHADGGRQILHYAMNGDFIGYHPDRGAAITYGAIALTDVTVCVMPLAAIDAICRTDPGVGMRIAWMLARDLSLSYDNITSVARQCARERVAHLLLQLYVRRRTRWPESRGDVVELPLTQELIADTLGLTPVHVNRMLAALRRDGVLHFKLGKLRILDPDRLIDLAGLDPDIVSNWIDAGRPPG